MVWYVLVIEAIHEEILNTRKTFCYRWKEHQQQACCI